VILAVVFLIHQVRKREEMRRHANVATTRAAEMDRLVQFGKVLAESLDSSSIRAATVEHLPLIASGRNVWAITRCGGQWIDLTPIDPAGRAVIERAAAHAMGDADVAAERFDESMYCIPLFAAERTRRRDWRDAESTAHRYRVRGVGGGRRTARSGGEER